MGAAGQELTAADRLFLLERARLVITSSVSGKTVPPAGPVPSVMTEKRGAFVTLHRDGGLRGCIGYIEAYAPLLETIEEMAAAAAFDDPRFVPVTADEVPELVIEISVLSPLEPLDDPARLRVGEHGLIVRRGGASGLLLPQVPVEYGWDRETFLAETCVKAGLPEDAWRRGAELTVFTADVFAEGSTV